MPHKSAAKTVGAVAALTGVSVRTLHHYDHIGLVVPSVRNSAGYRGYTDADVERLHAVLVYRAAGLPLDEIAALLDEPNVDVGERLRGQHALLTERVEQLRNTVEALEKLMEAHRSGIQLTAEEQVEIFGNTAFTEEHAAEAQERWGDTDAWRESQRRAAAYTKNDWQEIKAAGDELLADLAEAKRIGIEPGSPRANELARRHRAGIERFYQCSPDMHVGIAEMYLTDERFTHYYDSTAPGLAQYVRDIVVASYSPA
jgi:MerR family transcriptional regulator, thiopeptide resistance regulator